MGAAERKGRATNFGSIWSPYCLFLIFFPIRYQFMYYGYPFGLVLTLKLTTVSLSYLNSRDSAIDSVAAAWGNGSNTQSTVAAVVKSNCIFPIHLVSKVSKNDASG